MTAKTFFNLFMKDASDTMTPLVEVERLAAHKEVFILGTDARANRLARVCRLAGSIKIEAFVYDEALGGAHAPSSKPFPSTEAPPLPLHACDGIFAQAEEGAIAVLCDGPLPPALAARFAKTNVDLYDARFTLNLFFPNSPNDHLLGDVAFLRLWHTMLARRGLAAAVRAQDDVPYIVKSEYDALSRPPYAYAMMRAATDAVLLGVPEISVVEFGVAGGNGLLTLEEHATAFEKEYQVKFRLYGFDGGKGLPKPTDHRDQPYLFCEGDYPMDEAALRARLTRSELVLGDIKETAARFWDEHPDAPPLGAVMFDIDYYSSTMDAFQLFTAPRAKRLPRAVCYFDDISWSSHVHDIFGELQAIADFNKMQTDMKIVQSLNLSHTRVQPAPWNDQIFVLHDFHHQDYARPLRLDGGTYRLDICG